MQQRNFRQSLTELLSRHPHLRRAMQTELRAERARTLVATDRHFHVWQSLSKLRELAPLALELLREHPEEVETWHDHKINLAAEYLEAVVDSLRCKSDHEVPPYQCEDEDLAGADPSLEEATDFELEDFE